MKSYCPILKIPTTASVQQRHVPSFGPHILKLWLGRVPGCGTLGANYVSCWHLRFERQIRSVPVLNNVFLVIPKIF